MRELTTHERMTRIYNHQEADRVPVTDWAWESTIANWHAQGMPQNVAWEDFFGLDKIARITETQIDTSPRCEAKVIEETDSYRIEKDCWGITKKNFKPISATPFYLDYEIHDRESWDIARQRMVPSRDRVNWDIWRQNYTYWRENGYWIEVGPWFGYDIVNARTMGTEATLLAMVDYPEWMIDMFNHGCDLSLTLLDLIWDAGYEFDELLWYDDIGYKNGLMISRDMWYEMVRPYQKRVIEWAHRHGIKAQLHSCGRVESLIPDFIEIGLDALNPMEVKAGMDPIALKRKFGQEISFRGGFDIRNWTDISLAEAEILEKLPILKENGGYVFSSDHSISDNVSLENYMRIVEIAKTAGKY